MLVPNARADHVVDDPARAQLAVKNETQRPGLVTGDDLKAARQLFVDPGQEIGRLETLRWLGMRALLLDSHDVERQVHINRDLEQ